MISKFSLYDFKALKEAKDIEIKPITVICGKNSIGKSSIIQSLLLLKQTLDKPIFAESELSLEGDYLHYSHLADISYNLPHPNIAKIKYTFDLIDKDNQFGEISFSFKQSAQSKKSKFGPYVSEISWIDGESNNTIKLEKDDLIVKKSLLSRLLKKDLFKNKDASNINSLTYGKLNLFHFFPNEIELFYQNSKDSQPTRFHYNSKLINFCRDLYSELKNISYLGPLRATPQRAYLSFSGQFNDLLADGSNIAQYMWQNREKRVVLDGSDYNFLDAVNHCLSLMQLDQKITIKRTNRILYQINAYIDKSMKLQVPISDIGFGYSQILPFIVKGITSEKKSITIFEQPELHLHPSSAGSIADLLILFAKNGKRSIIETHSPDLINKLRLRVIQAPELKEIINIIFLDKTTDNKTFIRQLKLDENGMPPEWPEGFIDDSQKLAQHLITARIKRS
ncbi:hypothetical protein TRIP_E230067 [uncultured Spirochaetota bacterium]|uniref:Endonuclease GajA/Old nuclease/RecF-like AAA domain-containing protein n=1 Tax=uncultured Spirochaetota bacterium TaxID=460511 RepID=A0A652ZVS2_9SPIR|nr:hypothetical protein TRIP_E230067 [uncultured Spirochaetota bacterium]